MIVASTRRKIRAPMYHVPRPPSGPRLPLKKKLSMAASRSIFAAKDWHTLKREFNWIVPNRAGGLPVPPLRAPTWRHWQRLLGIQAARGNCL